MERTLAGELGGHVGERVRLQGWLHHQRQPAPVGFGLLRDRSGIAQIVIVDADLRQQVAGLVAESVIEVVGEVVRSEQAPAGVEVVDPEIVVLSGASQAPALELRRPELNAQLPNLLDHAADSLRHPPRRAVAQIASASEAGFRSALQRLGFTEVFTPKVVASATESGAKGLPSRSSPKLDRRLDHPRDRLAVRCERSDLSIAAAIKPQPQHLTVMRISA